MAEKATATNSEFSISAAMALDNPLDAIEATHRIHARICDCLEAIADGLPDDVDRRLASCIASSLRYELPLHHRDEDEGLFPLLEMRAVPQDNVTVILERLTQEHSKDEGFADELNDVLNALGRGEPVNNPEMVGYMLRGFFETYRRHLHWEDVLVLPLARQRLTDDDLDKLKKIFVHNRAEFSREMRQEATGNGNGRDGAGGLNANGSGRVPH